MTSQDHRLIAELGLIFDALVEGSSNRRQEELENAASRSLSAVTRWMIAKETARLLGPVQKPVNQRTH